jgi:hypothetical protein
VEAIYQKSFNESQGHRRARKPPEPGKLPQGIEVTSGDLLDSVSFNISF